MAAILRAAVNMARRGIGRFHAADMSGVSGGVKDACRPPAPAQSGRDDLTISCLIGTALGHLIMDALEAQIKQPEIKKRGKLLDGLIEQREMGVDKVLNCGSCRGCRCGDESGCCESGHFVVADAVTGPVAANKVTSVLRSAAWNHLKTS